MAASAFHAELPGYRPTELLELPALADELGVGRVLVKDESTRLGLGAFKVLGASWAIAKLLTRDGGVTVDGLRRVAAAHPVELVAATDGNHGRAVAWAGRLLGLNAVVGDQRPEELLVVFGGLGYLHRARPGWPA